MPDYKQGKIYSIRSFQTDDIYIGSTTQELCNRMSGHRRNYKKYLNGKYTFVTSFDILKYDDAYIELIEKYPCTCKKELEAIEGKYIRKMDCVNRRIEGRTLKQYREDNKEQIKKYKKQHYESNKQTIALKQKQYYETNKQKILLLKKQKRKQKITCVCGSTVCKAAFKRHERTKKHIKYIELNK